MKKTTRATRSVGQMTLGTQAAAAAAADMSACWPIGSVFISVVNTNPSTLLGFGTWVSFGAGRVLVGRDGADADFNAGEETGGSKAITPTGTVSQPTFSGTAAIATSAVSAGTPAGANAWPANPPTIGSVNFTPAGTLAWPAGVPTFTGAPLAAHAHELPFQIPSTTTTRQIAAATFGGGTSRAATAVSTTGTANTTSAAVALSESKSAGTPSGTVAWPAGVPTFAGTQGAVPAASISWPVNVPAFTGSALGTHSHTLTPAGTVSQPTFTGDTQSVVQPYIVVWFWKRTA
jgi:hypothetical protein